MMTEKIMINIRNVNCGNCGDKINTSFKLTENTQKAQVFCPTCEGVIGDVEETENELHQ